MYKLVAIDMDGTLLTSKKTISERTKRTIKKATEKGVQIVLASGRPLEGLMPYVKELGLDTDKDYVLSYNGAIVQKVSNKEMLVNNTLIGKDLTYLYELSQEIESNIHAFSKEGCITPKMSKYSELEGTINQIPVKEIDYANVGEQEQIIKIMLIDPPEILEENIKKLPEAIYDDYTIVRSAPYFLEFLHKDANKGAGVAALADSLGIDRKDVMCIGDAGNDLHMIQYAGMGVAMGNAFEEIKEIADYITGTNDEDGVAQAIEKFCLNV